MARSYIASRGQDRHRELARHYNAERPHGSLGNKPPAPGIPALAARASSQPPPAPRTALADSHEPGMNIRPGPIAGGWWQLSFRQ